MLKLLKYEFRKTLLTKIVLLALTAVVEALFLYAVFKGQEGKEALSIALLTALAGFGIFFMGIQSLLTLHKDMNTKQGYMLFMTPNSTYRILGAKVLENGVSTLLAGAFYFALGVGDITLLLSREQSLEEILDMFKQIASALGAEISFRLTDVLSLVIYMLMSWLSTVLMAYVADVVASSLLNGKKGGLFISFVLFLALNFAAERILGLLLSLLPDMIAMAPMFLIRAAFCLIVTVFNYFVSARLMEKYLSV